MVHKRFEPSENATRELKWFFEQGQEPKLTRETKTKWNRINNALAGGGARLQLYFEKNEFRKARGGKLDAISPGAELFAILDSDIGPHAEACGQRLTGCEAERLIWAFSGRDHARTVVLNMEWIHLVAKRYPACASPAESIVAGMLMDLAVGRLDQELSEYEWNAALLASKQRVPGYVVFPSRDYVVEAIAQGRDQIEYRKDLLTGNEYTRAFTRRKIAWSAVGTPEDIFDHELSQGNLEMGPWGRVRIHEHAAAVLAGRWFAAVLGPNTDIKELQRLFEHRAGLSLTIQEIVTCLAPLTRETVCQLLAKHGHSPSGADVRGAWLTSRAGKRWVDAVKAARKKAAFLKESK